MLVPRPAPAACRSLRTGAWELLLPVTVLQWRLCCFCSFWVFVVTPPPVPSLHWCMCVCGVWERGGGTAERGEGGASLPPPRQEKTPPLVS